MKAFVRKLAKGLLIGAAIVGGLLLLAQDQQTLRIRSDRPADAPDSLSYVARLVGAAVTTVTASDVLTNGDEIFPAMLAAIDGAHERVVFETYIFESGDVATQFVAAFIAAAARGVKCDMVVDAVGSGSIEQDVLDRLRAAGCDVRPYNSTSWWQLEEINYRTHRKLLVVDGDIAFTGGAGIADHWTGHAQDETHWRDTQVRLQGPVAHLMEGAFYENFIEAAERPVTPVLHPDAPAEGEAGNALVVRSSPTGGASDLKRLYLLLIAAARRTLDIQSPYVVTDASTAWAIDDARARGVQVRLLTESDTTDAMPVKYASRAAYQHLLDEGVEVYEYAPTMMHAKVMIVDGIWTMFGSANFDNRSLELNDELNVAVVDPSLALRFTAQFERDLRSSRRLDGREWARRPAMQKVREKFWMGFSEVF